MDYIHSIKSKNIVPSNDTDIYIFAGYGHKTGKDIYINDIVTDYRLIPKMKYTLSYANGDCTVLT